MLNSNERRVTGLTEAYLSAEFIDRLLKKLVKLRTTRENDLKHVYDIFGNAELLAKSYVEPDCQHHNPADEEEVENIAQVRAPVSRFLNDFLKNPTTDPTSGKRVLFILADAGMGKSSLLSIMYMTWLTAMFPHPESCHLYKLGRTTLEDLQQLQEGRSRRVLLLDSLDEDPLSWGRPTQRITELLEATHGFHKVIITCRTQFFPEGASNPIARPGQVRVAGYTSPAVYLSPFNDEQVASYVSKMYPVTFFDRLLHRRNKEGEGAQRIVACMQSLRFRPLLLSHLRDLTKGDLFARDTEQWNEFDVFLEMVEQWLLREQSKIKKTSNREVTAEDLFIACVRVAEVMFVREQTSTTVDEVRDAVWNPHSLSPLNDFDISGRSLLNRDSLGRLRFSHSSVMEFLLAWAVLNGEIGVKDFFHRRRAPTDEMKRFLVLGSRRMARRQEESGGVTNSAGRKIFRDIGNCPDGFSDVNGNYQEHRFFSCHFKNGAFVSCKFTAALFVDCTFENCTFRDCEFKGLVSLESQQIGNSYEECEDVRCTESWLPS